MNNYILEMENITKEFPGVKALDNVSLKIRPNTIHGVVGENGAGKSTLMKLLSGVYPYGTYSGVIKIDGKEKRFKNVKEAEQAGIAIIHQELMLFPELTIAENIHLKTMDKFVNRDKMHIEALKWMDMVGLKEDPETVLKNIGTGKQQLVEIAKVLSLNARILILDEPTSALTDHEVEHLMELLKNLKKQGVACIYISHKLKEVLNLCDEITVLRDGKTIDTKPVEEMDERKIINLMVGRDMSNRFPPKLDATSDEVVLKVENMNMVKFDDPSKYILNDINFSVKRGEILGIAGLMGAGRTELVSAIFGDFKGKMTGKIYVEGKLVKIENPQHAIDAGLGLLTEDRKHNGLNLIGSVKENIAITSLDKFTKMGVINQNQIVAETEEMVKKVKIKTPSIETEVMNLSGGNQQKVVVSKWLMVRPKVLIFDEPTRGIDVGAKYEIYCLMNELKSQGIAIIMVSSELPEILGMSDRIIVLNEGRIVGELNSEDATEVSIMEKLV